MIDKPTKVKKKAVPISRNSLFPEVKEYEKYEESFVI
jgi:hypothetical protein